jgi:hypothetical protein
MSDRLQNLINKNYSHEIQNDNIIEIMKMGDADLIAKYYSKIMNTNDIRLSMVKKILTSDNFKTDNVVDFFKILTPLNVEYNFGYTDWNFKKHGKYLLIQNTILSNNNCMLLNRLYLDPIKKILDNSNIVYDYYEFKNERAHKQIDIIFMIYL